VRYSVQMKNILEKLGLLKTRFKRRLKLQQKHFRKYEHFKARGKRGDKARAAYHLRRFKVHRKAVAKLVELTAEEKRELEALKRRNRNRRASGEGDWDGTESVAREIEWFVEVKSGRGDVSGSEKREETYGNPGSDHHVSQTNAFAIDFLLANDYAMAAAIAAYFGVDWAGDYSAFYVVRGGHTFRIQIIAGTHGTGPHLHVGCRLV
jgi:hypothetical protein